MTQNLFHRLFFWVGTLVLALVVCCTTTSSQTLAQDISTKTPPTAEKLDKEKSVVFEDAIQAEWRQMHESKQPSLDAFEQAKFGMFIHWGLYAIPAGEWQGKRLPSISEWIMKKYEIPRAEYAKLAEQFNPVKFDANQWAAIADDAGMRYMVITSKHHDGFALFDSDASDFNVVDATPFGRDVVGELHAACKRQGIHFGLYYSHSLDWTDGGDGGFALSGAAPSRWAKPARHNSYDPSPASFEQYLEQKAKPQVREILTRYPDLWTLWYDTPQYMSRGFSFDFYKLPYELQPQLLIAERIGNGFGDFNIPGDNKIPTAGERFDLPWETVGTLNNSWGYKYFDDNWKSVEELLFWLVDVVSKGGNYMLNVGPDAEGQFPPECVERLQEIGRWMKVNGDAIYGTSRWVTAREGPTQVVIEGTKERRRGCFHVKFTSKDIWFTQKGKTLYAIALLAPEDRQVNIKTLGHSGKKPNPLVRAVRLLGSDGELTWRHEADALVVQLPENLPGEHGYALAIETE